MGTLLEAVAAEEPAVTGSDEAAMKYAMLSVYYASIGDQFDVSGAPTAFVPPEVAPQPLAKALAVLATDSQKLEQAIWQIVRNTPIRQAWEKRSRYPREIKDYLSTHDQQVLDERRAEYRRGASLVAALLRACHHDDLELFNALRRTAATPEIRGNEGYTKVVKLLYDKCPDEFEQHLATVADTGWSAEQKTIDLLEKEVGFGIATYVERLAATAAYESFLHNPGRLGHQTDHHLLSIYPVHSVIRQSTSQLWTSATVTTLAHGKWDGLLASTQPDRWHDGSDVIRTSHYVSNPNSTDRIEIPVAEKLQGFLYEVAAMSWGSDTIQQAVFRNVLNVSRNVKDVDGHTRKAIDVEFSLCRSVSSDVLWDRRNGGITLNEGFLRVAPLGDDRWRVTSRKLLRFSDRTPYAGTNGWADFGQMLNHLAPAALSWWVDTETYSLGARTAQRETTATQPMAQPANTDEDGQNE